MPSCSTAHLFSPATPAAARAKSADGSLKTTGWRPSWPCLISSSTTPASATYIWMLTNRKESHRVGKVQLIDARQMYIKMRKSLGKKRNELSQEQINDITRIHGNFQHGETLDITDEDPVNHLPRTRARVVSKVFDNDDFGYNKVTVERPLRLNFAATPERISGLKEQKVFQNLAHSEKSGPDPTSRRDSKGQGQTEGHPEFPRHSRRRN